MGETLEALREQPWDANREALRAVGIHRITAFVTTEVPTDGDGVLVHVFEADDAASVERFFSLDLVQPVIQRFEGIMVASHTHDAVLKNIPVYDVATG